MDMLLTYAGWGIALVLAGALGLVIGKGVRDRVPAPKEPWRIGTLGIILTFVGVALALIVIAADLLLQLNNVPEGLPEGLTTPILQLAGAINGSGGTCIAMRTREQT